MPSTYRQSVPVTFWVPDKDPARPVRSVRIDGTADCSVTEFNLDIDNVDVTSFGDLHQHVVFRNHRLNMRIERRLNLGQPVRLIDLAQLSDLLFEANRSNPGTVLQASNPVNQSLTIELTDLRMLNAHHRPDVIDLEFITNNLQSVYTGAAPIPAMVQQMPVTSFGGYSAAVVELDGTVIDVEPATFQPVRRRLAPRNQ